MQSIKQMAAFTPAEAAGHQLTSSDLGCKPGSLSPAGSALCTRPTLISGSNHEFLPIMKGIFLQCTATPAVQDMLLHIQNLNSLGVICAILRCKITPCVHTRCVSGTCLGRCGVVPVYLTALSACASGHMRLHAIYKKLISHITRLAEYTSSILRLHGKGWSTLTDRLCPRGILRRV